MSKRAPIREPQLQISRYRGLTFIELMVTLIVMAILLVIGVPAVRDFVMSNQTTTQTNQFLADLALARTQALVLSRSVRISATGSWDAGWVVASDANTNGAIDGVAPLNDELFRQQGAAPEDFQLTMQDAGGTTLTSLWFDRLGAGVQELPSNVSVSFPITMHIERPDNNADRAVTVCVAASGVAASRKGVVSC